MEQEEKTVYALGFFDGVHIGHQALLRQCETLARRCGARAGVITFSDHPDALVARHAPALINTAREREFLLRAYGAERIVTLPFDEAMMRTPWQVFFRRLIADHGAAGLVCGEDFRFGDRGLGNAEGLRGACRDAGLACAVVPEQRIDGVTVSSTYIRALLAAGEVARAAAFLGHRHVILGEVVPGAQLGRTLGTPTANLCAGSTPLRRGVYACRAYESGEAYLAAVNVGVRPTVGGTTPTVEPWLLDFSGDLYGKTLRLEFYEFLRPEYQFPSVAALQAEIRKNAAQVRDYFAKL